MRNFHYYAAMAAALMCVSCKSTTTGLANQSYVLTELNGTPLQTINEAPSITFAKGRVNATVGCNQIMADYTVGKDGKLTFAMGAMTKMYCPDEMREDEFVAAFNKVARYSVSADGKEMSFLDEQGNVLFKAKK
ncbi:MAG: META domain-containing protein [Muribaculaceae bacterium]|nr:META domain-containing protein [Muribaculaceae bacterium]